MKKTLLINFILLFVVFSQAQVKPKVSAQPAKPSKQVTINYIIEKLNEYCTGKCKEVLTMQKDIGFYFQDDYTYMTYNIEENSGLQFLRVEIKRHWKKFYLRNSDVNVDEYSNIIAEIPVNKINTLVFVDVPEYVTKGILNSDVTHYGFRCLGIHTKGNNIKLSDDSHSYMESSTLFPIFNMITADEEKLKKSDSKFTIIL